MGWPAETLLEYEVLGDRYLVLMVSESCAEGSNA